MGIFIVPLIEYANAFSHFGAAHMYVHLRLQSADKGAQAVDLRFLGPQKGSPIS